MRKIVIAHPYIPETAKQKVLAVLDGRWIGQGPLVDEFEKKFEEKFGVQNAVAVNSGTSALELAYDLIGIGPGDEVIVPVLTCTATNLPLVRRGAKLVFADIKDDLTVDPEDIRRKITDRTRAIVVVDLNGIQATREDFYNVPGLQTYRLEEAVKIPVIVDAAQALGNFGGEYTCCSFQAIKHITTGDGGMLICRNPEDAKKAKLWRWFGIDRSKKIENNWQPYKQREILFDINFPGYKFQMNDIAAALGIAGLEAYDEIIEQRRKIFEIYQAARQMVDGPENKHGYACLLVDDRDKFCEFLNAHGVETNVMQVRNDIYSVFRQFRSDVPNMDRLEEKYICIPLHNRMSLGDAEYVAEIMRVWKKD